MEFRGVRGSQIAAVGYDADTQELQLLMTNGRRVSYPDVMAQHAEGLQTAGEQAGNVGRYFAENITGRYTGKDLT